VYIYYLIILGTDVRILKIFSPKNGEKLAFLTQNKAKLGKLFIIALVFKKKANFSAENWSKIAENWDLNIDPKWHYTCVHFNTFSSSHTKVGVRPRQSGIKLF
jgi:hypothetical protein